MSLATGGPPHSSGSPSPAAALAAAPVAAWPLSTVAADGRRVDVASALGTGGSRVLEILGRLAEPTPPPPDLDVAVLAAATPAGPVLDPVRLVGFAEAVEASAAVDRAWLAAVDERRRGPRAALAAAGRGTELEAALHLAMLLATTPLGDTAAAGSGAGPGLTDTQARVASGARLWLLGGVVAWALTGDDDPFACWADLVSFGLWPVGPAGGRLVVGVDGGPATQARD